MALPIAAVPRVCTDDCVLAVAPFINTHNHHMGAQKLEAGVVFYVYLMACLQDYVYRNYGLLITRQACLESS